MFLIAHFYKSCFLLPWHVNSPLDEYNTRGYTSRQGENEIIRCNDNIVDYNMLSPTRLSAQSRNKERYAWVQINDTLIEQKTLLINDARALRPLIKDIEVHMLLSEQFEIFSKKLLFKNCPREIQIEKNVYQRFIQTLNLIKVVFDWYYSLGDSRILFSCIDR